MSIAEKRRHDFRNQLTIILGYADLLLGRTPPDDPQRADVEEIRTAAKQALAMLAEIFPPAAKPAP